MVNTINILFCGTGGQGVLKASEVAGVAAIANGFHVRKSEVHGMAQRGGSVESHLRFGSTVHSPLIMPGIADYLVCFHAGEANRLRPFLKKDGVDFSIYLDKISELSDPRYGNTLFLGILAAKLPIAMEHWYSALESVVAKKMEENKVAFQKGLQIGK
jgi:indolepyruvate ferredoxin oxidoreductase, beta subunit